MNPVVFMLAIALVNGAFRDYNTLIEILAIEPPPHTVIWRVEWKESILDYPFLSICDLSGSDWQLICQSTS